MVKGVIIYIVSVVLAGILLVLGIVIGGMTGEETGGIAFMIFAVLAWIIAVVGAAVAVAVAAVAKGQSAALGAALGLFLGWIGLVIIGFMEDKSAAAAPPQPAGHHMAGGPPGAPGMGLLEPEQVLFQGALNGRDANLQQNARLAEAGLIPTKRMMTDAMHRRAEIVRLDPKPNFTGVTFVIDGVPHPTGKLPKQQGLAVTQMVKLLCGLDTKERSKPQSGGIKAQLTQTPYELHVEAEPVGGGAERLTVRVVNLKERPRAPEDVGFTDYLKSKLREMLHDKDGIVLVCGPSRSGTTTSTHMALRSLDPYLHQIYSLADNSRSGFELINVVPYQRKEEEDLADTFDRMLRDEAEIVFLSTPRDAETARTMFEYQTRLGMLCEMDTATPAEAIQKCIRLVGDPKTVTEGLEGVLTQKLIRRLCDACKEAYRPHPKMLQQLGLPPETQTLLRPRKPPPPGAPPEIQQAYIPCASCNGLGYRGRAGMFELVEMTDGMKQVVLKGADPAAIRAQMKKDGMQTLQKEGLRLVAEGATSLEELQRVFQTG